MRGCEGDGFGDRDARRARHSEGGGRPDRGRGRQGPRLVTAPPDKGEANRAVIELVAAALGLPKSAVELVRGETGREKLRRIEPR